MRAAPMMHSVLPSGIKGEFFEPDLRNMQDNNFLKNIGSDFGLMSPIEKSTRPANAYEHNLNLTMELQRMVNEHLRMEDYPAEPALYDDEPMQLEEVPDFNPFTDFGEVEAQAP